MSGYRFFFGTYDERITLQQTHETSGTIPGPNVGPGEISLKPWELKHVSTLEESMSGQITTIGIPNKPQECAYVFDLGGPVRTFTISGTRYDADEEISNFDFIHTQFNKQTMPTFYHAMSTKSTDTYYSIGIEWLTSMMQSISKGFVLRILCSDDGDGRMPIYNTLSIQDVQGQEFNVGLTGFNYSMHQDNPGVMDYTISLTERKMYEGGPIYQEYITSNKQLVRCRD